MGRGGRVTVSRPRGRSIDREREREEVQPTGIPAHMRRQPENPAVRENRPAAPPQRLHPQNPPPQRYPPSPLSVSSHYSFSPPRETRAARPPTIRPQSYIVSSPGNGGPGNGGGALHAESADYDSWASANSMIDYRHRSRSPLRRSYTPEQVYQRHPLAPPPEQRWRSPSPPPLSQPPRYSDYSNYRPARNPVRDVDRRPQPSLR